MTINKLDDDTIITPKVWAVYEEEKEDGETVTILSILDIDNAVCACQSATFRKSFLDIAEIFEDGEEYSIKKISGETKAGRKYINCVLDMDSLQ